MRRKSNCAAMVFGIIGAVATMVTAAYFIYTFIEKKRKCYLGCYEYDCCDDDCCCDEVCDCGCDDNSDDSCNCGCDDQSDSDQTAE